METSKNPRARLLVEIPEERYRILLPQGRAPRVGDVVVLDQGFTSEDGLPMALVYFPDVGYGSWYQADVYESELE